MKPIEIKPISESQKLVVRRYFETWEKWWFTTSKIRMIYWRMKANWETIEKAEEEILKSEKRKEESYRRNKEQEINQNIKNYRIETWWNIWKYELMKVNEREDWRTLIIWFLKSYDVERDRQTRSYVVEIEERQNRDYFKEIVKRYNLLIE